MFITDSNLLLFQRKCKNKDCIQKLGLAVMMAQKAEQISIQVGNLDHIPPSLWDLGCKTSHTVPPVENWLSFPLTQSQFQNQSFPPRPSSLDCLNHPLFSLPLDKWNFFSVQTEAVCGRGNTTTHLTSGLRCTYLILWGQILPANPAFGQGVENNKQLISSSQLLTEL